MDGPVCFVQNKLVRASNEEGQCFGVLVDSGDLEDLSSVRETLFGDQIGGTEFGSIKLVDVGNWDASDGLLESNLAEIFSPCR